MDPRCRQNGYSLVELMVVVTVIGISVLAFAPGFSRAMAERKASMATRELVRLGRRARAEASAYGRSYMVWLAPSAGATGGPLAALLRGNTASCTTQNWAAINPIPCDWAQGCVESVDFGTGGIFDLSGYTLNMVEEDVGGAVLPTARAVCYSPLGIVFMGTGPGGGPTPPAGAALSSANTVSGGAVMVLALLRDGAVLPPVHRVLYPLGGPPSVLRRYDAPAGL